MQNATQLWFEKNVDVDAPPWVCWPWKGAPELLRDAQRVAYETRYVPPGSAWRIVASCGGAGCVNPAHMLVSGQFPGLEERLREVLGRFEGDQNFRVRVKDLKRLLGLPPLAKRAAFRAAAERVGLHVRHTNTGDWYYRGDWYKSAQHK